MIAHTGFLVTARRLAEGRFRRPAAEAGQGPGREPGA